jgi:hypothetical protein
VIDIESKALVGDDPLKIVRPAAQRLSCSIPTAVAAYYKRLQTHMTRHRILPHLHDLYLTQNGNFTPLQQQHMEKLDWIRSEGMLCAEKNVGN